MNISGVDYVGFASQKSFSFDADFRFSNISGTSSFGFSGENGYYKAFFFEDSRVKDFQGEFVSSYLPNQDFNISGNYENGILSYYIDQNLVSPNLNLCSPSFSFENLVFESSNGSMEVFPNLHIFSEPEVAIDFPYAIPLSGNPVTGVLKNNSDGSWNSFKIFSATSYSTPNHYHMYSNLTGQKIFGGQGLDFVLAFDGNSSFSTNSNKLINPLNYSVSLDTNFGSKIITGSFEVLPSPYYASRLELNSVINSGTNIWWDFSVFRQACSGIPFEFKLNSGFWDNSTPFSQSFDIYTGCSVNNVQVGLSGSVPYDVNSTSYFDFGFMSGVGCNDNSILEYNFLIKYKNTSNLGFSNAKYSISGVGENLLLFSGLLES